MGKPNKICKTCGKPYYGCTTCENEVKFTPWRSICCSIECYKEYLQEVLEARGELVVSEEVVEAIEEPTIEEEIKTSTKKKK